ncbi:hypothetical protein [Caballeronia zhejiangensis]|uniref:hypothetical protein n=1 Tax=Caballeronia zhejiangensis TaxID=871203 RepID=UPI001EF4654A|nr:hypothetical protein [Caballeronia zhejiangensis]MCG7400251.1 hypothetical protein [Caballeronia zhejiangensis]
MLAGADGLHKPFQHPAEDELTDVDKIAAGLAKAPMAFNTPPPITIDDTATVELRVGPNQTPEEVKKAITYPGTIQVHEVRISNRMQADISGDKAVLSITSLDPDIQAVSGQSPTNWRWLIKPLKEGKHTVAVKLYALVKIDGTPTPLKIASYDGTIVVTVTTRQQVEAFVKQNWQWLWTMIFVPAGGLWWKYRTKKEPFNDS